MKLVGVIHPAVWWALGLSLAVWSAVADNLVSLVAIIAVTTIAIWALRDNAPWAQSISFYLATGLLVIAIRLIFRIIFNFDSNADVFFSLPRLSLHFGPLGDIELFGRVSRVAMISALRDGLRMAAIIMCIGLANSLANPRRLLKSTPSALYEVAAAFVIAINMAPQLIASSKRIRKFSKLRGRSRSRNVLTRIVIPTLEDTIDRSMALAASMDARGFGRRGSLTRTQSTVSRTSSLVSIAALGIASFSILAGTEIWVAGIWLAVGIAGLAATLTLSRMGNLRTKYPRASRRWADSLLLTVAILIAILAIGGVLK